MERRLGGRAMNRNVLHVRGTVGGLLVSLGSRRCWRVPPECGHPDGEGVLGLEERNIVSGSNHKAGERLLAKAHLHAAELNGSCNGLGVPGGARAIIPADKSSCQHSS